MKKIFVLSIVVFLAGLFLSADAVYTISKPSSISNWYKGRKYTIKWDKKGDSVSTVKIRLFNQASEKVLDIVNNTSNDGSYEDWKIPGNIVVGKYFVRVKNTLNTKWGDSQLFNIKSGFPGSIVKDAFKKVDQKPLFKPPEGMFKPKIISSLPAPIGPLRPGSRLFVKGKGFGKNKGKILLKGNFPGGYIELENVSWVSDTKVNGYVPQSANGQPNQNVHPIVVSSLNFKSDPGGSRVFEGRDVKILTADAVGVQCGNDGNCNYCNKVVSCDLKFIAGCSNDHAICGFHDNNWGAIGDDVGDDIYSINLKNGWVLKSMQKVKWHKSSGDEVLTGPSPSFPVGSSTWNTVIHWKVTPNDNVRYDIKIFVEGPIGTTYK